jgi:hypothetical protein
MYCLVKRNAKGNVTNVTTPQGDKSKLFEEINSNPFLGTPELSLRIFATAYNKDVQENIEDYQTYSTGEPKIVLKSSETGKVFQDVESAILDADANTMEIGFIKKNLTVDTVLTFDTNKTEKSRFIKEAITQGVISPTRILNENGENVFQGEGQFDETRRVTGMMAKELAKLEYGKALIYDKETNTFTIPSKEELEEITYSDGRVEVIRTEDIPDVLSDPNLELKKELVLKYMSKFATSTTTTDKPQLEKDLGRLETSLNTFLSSLGFSTSTLENYRKDYKTKYGQDPDIQALLDLANKVVAFSAGEYSVENLSEEVAHIAIETYEEQDSIESALAVVNLTPEYNEFAEYYRSKYSKDLQGVDLETKVRKEILGKILKNVLVGKYLNTNTTSEQKTIIQKLQDIWQRFLNFIRSNSTPYHISYINEINDKIADAVVKQKNLFSTQNIKEDYFYSAMDSEGRKLEKSLKEARGLLDNLFKSVLKQPTPNKAQLEAIVDEMVDTDILSSINTVVSITSNQKNVLRERIKESTKIDPVSFQTYLQLKENLIPVLQSIRFDTKGYDWKTKEQKQRSESLMTQIDTLTAEIANLEAEVVKGVEGFVEDAIKERLEETTLSEEQKQWVLNTTKNGMKDLTYMQRRFGLASNSPNAVVQAMQELVAKTYFNTTQKFRNDTKQTLDEIFDNGWNKYEKELIERDENGKKTGYILSPILRGAAEKDLKNKKIELLAKYTQRDAKAIEKDLEVKNERSIVGPDKYYEYKQELSEYENSVTREARMNKDYQEERTKTMDALGLSPYTREYLSTTNNNIQQIKGKYRRPDGSVDLSKASNSEKLIIKNHNKSKKQDRSAFDQFGEYRPGLKQVRFDELTEEDFSNLPFTKEQLNSYRGDFVVMEPGLLKQDLPSDSLLALELFTWNLNFSVTEKNKVTIKTEFEDEIKKIEAEGNSAYDWALSNGQISLNDTYYDNMVEGKSYVDAARSYLQDLPNNAVKSSKQDALSAYEKALRIKRDILRQNKKTNQPIEVDFKNMDSKTVDRLLQLDEELSTHLKTIGLPQNYRDVAEGGVEVTQRMSEDYEKIKTEKGLTDYELCIQNMSPGNKRAVEAFKSKTLEIISGFSLETGNKAFENFIEDQFDKGVVNDSMEIKEVHEKLVNEYAKTKVASYLKRMEPTGYSDVIEALKNNTLKVSDLLNRTKALNDFPAARYIDVTPDYSWTEDLMSDKFLNKRYPKDSAGFYKKYNLDNWINKKFFDFFGIDMKAYIENPTEDLNKLVATKNKEQYELLKRLVGLKEQSLELYGETEATDKFKMVQLSATSLEKIYDVKNLKSNLKDSMEDLVQNRSDELIYGDTIDSNLRVIPRYYKKDLETPDMLSESIISAELINYRQAILYTERKKAEADMLAFQTHLGRQEFKAHTGIGSKVQKKLKGQVSNYYQFGEEFVNHHLYGVQQNRHFVVNAFGKEVDLVRLVSKFQGWSTLNNLAFNPLAAMTSMSTGILNNVTDRAVGDRYHRSSINRSNSVVTRLMGEHLSQAGKINKKDGLTAAMELNGLLDDKERIQNSTLGRLGRIIGSTPFGLDALANKPVVPKVMMNVYCDTRLYKGKFLGWNEYQTLRRREGAESKQIESEWYALKNESLLDYVNLNTFQPNEKFKALPNNDILWEKTMTKVSNKIKRDVQAVDGVLSEADKVAAQRDVLTNFLLQHRGWFLINLSRRFKKAHFNAADGKIEEGHYRSVIEFIKENWKDGLNPGKLIAEYKSLKSTDLNRQQNIKRSFAEAGISIVLGFLGMVLLGDDEDDEDKTYGEVLAEYWYLKTYSEYNSSQIFGIPGTIEEMVKSPIPSSKFFSNFNPYSLLTNVDEFEGSEDEPGINKALKMLLSTNPVTHLPYKRYSTYGSKEALAKSLGYFKKMNAGTLFNLGPEDKKE